MHFHHTPYIHGFQRRPPSVPPNLQALQTLTIPLDKTQRLQLTRHPLPMHLFLLLRPLATRRHHRSHQNRHLANLQSPKQILQRNPNNTTTITLPLDFNSHHSPNFTATTSSHSAATNEYPCCNAKYSEYTPCEDSKMSLKFDRDRLIYSERHCPEKSEFLKCRIPAPYGYKNVFSWPRSRDLAAWYANVPHKELTVEKAAQNWIIYEGDTFKFLWGGTMFPHGADAYIDDIGKLINLKDGSIRTAIDTGCGICGWAVDLKCRWGLI